MKPKLPYQISIIIFLVFYNFQHTIAQNIAPFWSTTGNSNGNANSRLGTTNAFSLRFFTNNVERMRILSTGNVGIGTLAPTQKLHVLGNINVNLGSGFYINNQRFLSTSFARVRQRFL